MSIKSAGLIAAILVALLALQIPQTDNKNGSDLYESCSFSPEMIRISGGTFMMGAGGFYGDEGPEHPRQVDDFFISKYEVTNGEFAEFVESTGYVTVAERQPDPSHYPDIPSNLLKPGSAVFVKLDEAIQSRTFTNWWHFREGANWRNPNGPDSDIDGMEDYPVVHIALEDAQQFAKWKGHRLPTEAEYEYASRGGLDGYSYATGKTLVVDGKYQSNTWQGFFPFSNSKDDGYEGLAPTGCYAPNGYGLHDLIGNVWEWTETPYYPSHSPSLIKRAREKGYQYGFDLKQPNISVSVVKGGSYLCAEDFCARYRPAARHAQDTNLGTSHIGFRTVKDI